MERTKFYSVDDLGNGLQLQRAQKVLDVYTQNKEYDDINDVLELYNIKLLIDNDLALKSWSDEMSSNYAKTVKCFGKDIVNFFRTKVTSDTFVNVEFQYYQDFWDVFEKYGLLDVLTSENIKVILENHPDQLENVLRCERIVCNNDDLLAEMFMKNPDAAVLLINACYVSDITRNLPCIYLPKSLTLEQKETLVDSYLDGNNQNLGIVRIIMQSNDTEQLKLSPRVRLKAKRLEPELAKIPDDTIVSSVQTGFTIEYINDASRPPKEETLDGLCFNFVYNEYYLDHCDDTALLNTFRSVFGYFDKSGLLTLCNNRNEDDIFEKTDIQRVKGLYRMNQMFRMKNNMAVSKLAMFDSYLRRKGKTLEGLIKRYFEKHFNDDYGFPSLKLNMPNDSDTFANKNKVIAPEMEAVVNQFNLYVEEGDIDPDLYENSMPLPITLGKSLLSGKHRYVVIPDGSNGIYKPMYLLFSDQSLLSHVEPFKDSRYCTLFNLLVNEDRVVYDNYENYQKPQIDYLVNNGYLNKTEGVLTFGNIPRIRALKLLYERREISYYHCEPDVRSEIDKMVLDGWLKYDEYMLSPEERHYVNFFLNNSEYSNGMQLRNKYSHGRSSCTQTDAEHKNAYYYFLMIFVIILLKMDEDMQMSLYLNSKVGI